MNPRIKSTDEIVAKVWSLVDALPQRGAIAQSDANAWVDEVVILHGEAAIWHAIRLNGFGGSEIGVLVRNHAGVRADHQASAHDIVAGKLMRKAPTESSGPMTRGHENEEPHSRRFYNKYSAVRDLDAFEGLKAAQGSRPWMRYSPDDVVQMPVRLESNAAGGFYPSSRTNGQNHRWLIDYKAPSQIDVSDEVAFQYACQLSQGAILCAEAGIELDGMMLSQFDWANWALKDDVVMWDQSLGQMVLDAGSFYWDDYVLKGLVPHYIRKQEAVGLDAYKESYQVAAEMHASLSALADASKKRADEIRPLMLAPIKDRRVANEKITFGIEGSPVLKMAAKQMLDREAVEKLFTPEQRSACAAKGKLVYDEEKMADHLRGLGVDIKQFRKPDLDPVKVYAMALELGFDADQLVKEQITMAASEPIKKGMREYIDNHYPLSVALVDRESALPEAPTALAEAELNVLVAQEPVG